MTTTTRKVQNPDNLTPEQVGEGYRLTFEDEREALKDDPRVQMWCPPLKWGPRFTPNKPLVECSTYRVPIETPPPPERFTIKPLEWKPYSQFVSDIVAETPWGLLTCFEGHEGYFWSWPKGEARFHPASTLEAAKAAAEAAYVARVKELLIHA